MGRHSKEHKAGRSRTETAAVRRPPVQEQQHAPAAVAPGPLPSVQPQHQDHSTFPRRANLPSPAAPISNERLASHLQTLPDLLQTAFWTSMCPGLHCSTAADSHAAAGNRGTGASGSGGSSGNSGNSGKGSKDDASEAPGTFSLPVERLADLRQQIGDAGVAQVAAAELPWECSMQALALAVVQLLQHGWPPAFLVVFDEVWDVIRQMDAVMKHTTGNACNMDILAWYVDPNAGHSGFSPHRDRQPDDAPATFREDGSAMYTTAWIPFTDACPENSCLYVVPRYADPGYHEGDPEEEDAPDPLQRALPNKEAYQHIRALPAEAGSAVLFTHRIIHWGSQGRRGYHTPRISMSYGCADGAFEAPYFSRDHLPRPDLGLRLALAGAQMIVYHERWSDMDARMLGLCHEAFRRRAHDFDATYRRKVTSEFVAASKELAAQADGAPAKSAPATAHQNMAAAPPASTAMTAGGAPAQPAPGQAMPAAAAASGTGAHAARANGRGGSAAANKRVREATAAKGGARHSKRQKRNAMQAPSQPQRQGGLKDEALALLSDSDTSSSSDDLEGGIDGTLAGGSGSDGNVLDKALNSMLEARMAGFCDDFEDDFDDFDEGVVDDYDDGADEDGAGPLDQHTAPAGVTGRPGRGEGDHGPAAADKQRLATTPSGPATRAGADKGQTALRNSNQSSRAVWGSKQRQSPVQTKQTSSKKASKRMSKGVLAANAERRNLREGV